MASGKYWQASKTLVETNRHMLESKLGADVSFLVQSDKNDSSQIQVVAHSYILVSRSPVFEAMLFGPLAEKSESIEIPELTFTSFQTLLEFMYTDDCTLDDCDSAIEVLYASKKYMITSLVEKCIKFVGDNININNVCSMFQQSIILQEETLITQTVSFIQKYTTAVCKSCSFCDLHEKFLNDFLAIENLMVLEFDLLCALIEWASRESKINNSSDVTEETADVRKTLQPFLDKIRFPLIPYKQLVKLNEQYKILSTEELHAIHEYQAGNTSTCALPYNCNLRGYKMSTRFKIKDDFELSELVRKEDKPKRKFALEFRLACKCSTVFALSLMCGPYLVKIAVFDTEGQLVSFTERDFRHWDEKDCCREMTIILADPLVCEFSEQCMKIEVYLTNCDVMFWYDDVITGKSSDSKHIKLRHINPEIISKLLYIF